MSDVTCWNCGKPLPELPLPVSRHEYCPQCAEPVHCCRMCLHFAPDRAEQCREERAEPPTDRTAANFCEFFALNRRAGPGAGDDAGEDARGKLEALFGGDAGDADEDAGTGGDHDDRAAAARSRLDALFGDDGTRSDGD